MLNALVCVPNTSALANFSPARFAGRRVSREHIGNFQALAAVGRRHHVGEHS
jgi:hypothetical protein